MAKIKRNCSKCSNKITDSYCSMRKDMVKASDSLCDGFKIVAKKVKIAPVVVELVKKSQITAEEVGEDFFNFLDKGGAWSLRTGKKLFKEKHC